MVVCLSDQQLCTGIALSIAALIKLNDTPIGTSLTGYHLNIVTDLVWFSSNTHLLSLLVVRSFAVSVKPTATHTRGPRKQFTMANSSLLRAILMCFQAALLLYFSYIQGYYKWWDMYDCPAACAIGRRKGGEPRRWMIANFVLIFYEYSISLFMLWRRGRKSWLEHLRHRIIDTKSLPPDQQSKVWMEEDTLIWKITRVLFLSIWYFESSETSGVMVQTVWHVLGYYWLITDRYWGHLVMEQSEQDKENELGFGQLVPLFLLLILIVQLLESLEGQ